MPVDKHFLLGIGTASITYSKLQVSNIDKTWYHTPVQLLDLNN